MIADPSIPSYRMAFCSTARPRAGAGVLRSGRLQHQLRHLPAVDRQPRDVALSHVDAHPGRAHIEDWGDADDRDRLLKAGWLQLQIETQFLANRESHIRVLDLRESVFRHANGVGGRSEIGHEKHALFRRDLRPLLTGSFILDCDGGTRDHAAAAVAHGPGELALIGLCSGRQRERD